MRESTRRRKTSTELFQHELSTMGNIGDLVASVTSQGTSALNSIAHQLGIRLIESLLAMERERLSGPDYHPTGELKKWASQGGSVYLGGEKVRIQRPRLRGSSGEVKIDLYEQLKNAEGFSKELLEKALRGLSGRKYNETLQETAEKLGVSKSSISRRMIEASSKSLKEFIERDLSAIRTFAIYLDTVHRGNSAYIVALAIDERGLKHVLGFWEGATENHDICEELFSDLESRGLILAPEAIYICDGGSGIIKALRDRFGKNLLLQRCTIHKDRNIQRHLPKKYRQKAHSMFRNAMNMVKLADAKKALKELRDWLAKINISAARSIDEAGEDLLTVQKLGISGNLKRSLHSTNPIESMFSQVRSCEKNIKRYKNSKVGQRWLAASLLHAETNFNRIQGYKDINGIIAKISRMRPKRRLAA